MAISINQVWPVVDLVAVSQQQNVAANVSFVLNGTLANPFNPNQISFIDAGFIRSVSITSVNDYSGNVFTINGIQNGVPVAVTMAGPGANETVYVSEPANISFDSITSITTDNDVEEVKIGTGNIGYLPLIALNTFAPLLVSWAASVRLPVTPASGITYSVYFSLENLSNMRVSFDNMRTVNGALFKTLITNSTSSDIGGNSGLGSVKFSLVRIISSTNPLTDTAYVTCLQI